MISMNDAGSANVLVRYSEIALKGKNMGDFEQALIRNIRDALPADAEVKRLHRRILVNASKPEAALVAVSKVFGVSSASPVIFAERSMDSIKNAALSLAKEGKTFRIETNRADKSFPKKSPEINQEAADFLASKGLTPKIKEPDYVIGIDISQDYVAVFSESVQGPGGLPTGTSGRVLCLLSGGIDSPVAAYQMMKRGCVVDFLHLSPFDDLEKDSKIHRLFRTLNSYQCGRGKLSIIPFLKFYESSMGLVDLDARYKGVLFRRFIYMCAEKMCSEKGPRAIVSGDSLGQVSSQTLENICAVDKPLSAPVFRPLISFDKEQIIAIAKKIGTYEASLEKYRDCCSFVTPDNPKTRSRVESVDALAERIGMGKTVSDSVDSAREAE
ncbi:MAG: tRNA uracil 4-sulfurtransferase ThiI [Candidatus Bilamarchaeaceae archaeon]